MVLKLSYKAKRWMIVIHSLFAAIMLGNMVVFLIFNIVAAGTDNQELVQTCYVGMHILSRTSVKASTIGATLTGILLSLGSNWGLFKYYWILAKEGLTVIAIGLNLWGMYAWTLDAMHLHAANDVFIVHVELWTGIIFQILSLILMYILSVFKPWGRRVQ